MGFGAQTIQNREPKPRKSVHAGAVAELLLQSLQKGSGFEKGQTKLNSYLLELFL